MVDKIKKVRVVQLSDTQRTAYKMEALSLLNDMSERLTGIASQLQGLPDEAFWVPEHEAKLSTPKERVLKGLVDIAYDDGQKPTESKQYTGACAVPVEMFDSIHELNASRQRFGAFWHTLTSIRVAKNDREFAYLSEIILDGTAYSRVNTHQAKRQIHTVEGSQPTRLGFTLYSSPNPKRITKDSALNRLINMLPEQYHESAYRAFAGISEDEDICLLRDNTPKNRVNVVQRIDHETKRFQLPAVMPILYMDNGKQTIIEYKNTTGTSVPGPPRKRESDPIYPGVLMYRYLPDYRFELKKRLQSEQEAESSTD